MTYSGLRKGVQARRAEDEDRAAMLQVAANLDYIAMIQGIELDDTEETTEDTTETEIDTETTTEED